MANISKYNGTSSFMSGLTSFGYYDNDVEFISDADKVIQWSARCLGYPIVDVELTNEQMYDAFESATSRYSSEIYDYKLRDNYLNYDGSIIPSGTFNMANVRATPSLGTIIRLAQTYGTEAQSGGNIPFYSGSIDLIANEQTYDLNAWATANLTLVPNDKIEIKRIFYEAIPAINRTYNAYNSNLGINSDFNINGNVFGGVGNYDTTYTLLPTDYDLLRVQATEFNDAIRKNAYSFQLKNNELKIFPIPRTEGKIWIEFIKVSERDASFDYRLLDGTTTNVENVVTNVSNVPFGQMTYSTINSNGKTWIRNMTLVECMRRLAMVRGKYTNIPLQNHESSTLNSADLYSLADKLETDLLTKLREMLEATSRQKQLEKQTSESENIKATLNSIPLPVYIF